ncbi:MAG: hypothetical protein R2712_21130 [Vicinamibacterales bacterium]
MKRRPPAPEEETQVPTTSPASAAPPARPPALQGDEPEVALFIIPGPPIPGSPVVDIRTATRLRYNELGKTAAPGQAPDVAAHAPAAREDAVADASSVASLLLHPASVPETDTVATAALRETAPDASSPDALPAARELDGDGPVTSALDAFPVQPADTVAACESAALDEFLPESSPVVDRPEPAGAAAPESAPHVGGNRQWAAAARTAAASTRERSSRQWVAARARAAGLATVAAAAVSDGTRAAGRATRSLVKTSTTLMAGAGAATARRAAAGGRRLQETAAGVAPLASRAWRRSARSVTAWQAAAAPLASRALGSARTTSVRVLRRVDAWEHTAREFSRAAVASMPQFGFRGATAVLSTAMAVLLVSIAERPVDRGGETPAPGLAQSLNADALQPLAALASGPAVAAPLNRSDVPDAPVPESRLAADTRRTDARASARIERPAADPVRVADRRDASTSPDASRQAARPAEPRTRGVMASAAPAVAPAAIDRSPATLLPDAVPDAPPTVAAAVAEPDIATPERIDRDVPRGETASAIPVAVSADDGIAMALQHLQRAYARRDAGQVKAVWPTVNERALARAFGGLRSQSVTFDRCRLNISGEAGEVECRGVTTYVPRIGEQYSRTEARQWRFRVRKADDNWLITSAAAR